MAQLLTITAVTLRPGVNQIGDIVGIFPDDHVFSKAELDAFKAISVEGKPDEVRAGLEKMKPDLSSFIVSDSAHTAEKKLNVALPKYSYAVKDEGKPAVADACKTNIKAVAATIGEP